VGGRRGRKRRPLELLGELRERGRGERGFRGIDADLAYCRAEATGSLMEAALSLIFLRTALSMREREADMASAAANHQSFATMIAPSRIALRRLEDFSARGGLWRGAADPQCPLTGRYRG
jgi:hypothetical protein